MCPMKRWQRRWGISEEEFGANAMRYRDKFSIRIFQDGEWEVIEEVELPGR